MPDDAAKGFGRSASLDTAGAEGAKPRAGKPGEGVAYPPWWMPALMGADSGTFTTKAELLTAVRAYNANPDAATATYGLIAGWDVSMITDMSWLFSGLANFNADFSSWDTSKVTNMYEMFFNSPAFNQPLSIDTSKVTDMDRMFQGARAFNQPLSFDTSEVTDMRQMFRSADAFNQPLSFDTSEVTDMDRMFQGAWVFNQPLSFDLSEVTDMREMFYGTSLSHENKLLIRCAWAGNPAFNNVARHLANSETWPSTESCAVLLSPPSPPPPSPSPPPTPPQPPPSPPLAPGADDPCTEENQEDRCKVTLKIKVRHPVYPHPPQCAPAGKC